MSEESTTPDPVELSRRFHEAASRLDFDAMVSFYAPDAVWEGRASGMTFEGRTAIRGFWEDATAAYEEFEFRREETLDVGNGVIFEVILQRGRPVASIGYVQLRYAAVVVWAKGLIERIALYSDPDEAREAAERLAAERA